MDKTSSPDAPVETQSRFWVGPLVAGCCFALGFGIAERVLTLETNAEEPVPESFTPLAFPGDSLQEIRDRFSDDNPSQEDDVTALEAAEAASRPAKPAVKTTPNPDLALQTPAPPVWTPPAWSDTQSIPPELEEEDGFSPSSAQEPELEPSVLPPGPEAFFEAIEAVTPPQL